MRKVKTRLTGADNLTRLVHLKRWKLWEVEVDEKEDVDENLESEGWGTVGGSGGVITEDPPEFTMAQRQLFVFLCTDMHATL